MSRDIPWSQTVTFAEVGRGLPAQSLEANERTRQAVARYLDVVAIKALSAELTAKPWLDGVEICGRINGSVTQTCSVTADDFDEDVAAEFIVRVVPPDSPNAPTDDAVGEIEIDLEADDPPDVAEGQSIDLAHYVVEHLALELDPFPRKPGAAFEPPPEEKPASPFAVLRQLRPKA
jgi:hypothetical protein